MKLFILKKLLDWKNSPSAELNAGQQSKNSA